MSDNKALATIDRLTLEISRFHFGIVVVQPGVLVDARDDLTWALDEIAQLREDLAGAQGAVVQMTAEITELSGRLFDAEEELATYQWNEERAEARLDSYLGV